MSRFHFYTKKFIPVAAAATVLILIFGYWGFRYKALMQENELLQQELTGYKQALGQEIEHGTQLSKTLEEEQTKSNRLGFRVEELTIVVDSLQKLVSTDKELLRKYSKVYFLSENYSPAQLSSIDPQYLYQKDRSLLFHTGALSRLLFMLEAAGRDGITLKVVSAYRSFYEQAAVKTGYAVLYGSGANQFSADQGYSEHQLGTAVDLNTSGTSGILAGFDKSAAYAWMNANAYKYGFILSYPAGNSYYQFEPWHWRFVGVQLATDLHKNNQHFYDLDQRDIDSYLITLFN